MLEGIVMALLFVYLFRHFTRAYSSLEAMIMLIFYCVYLRATTLHKI